MTNTINDLTWNTPPYAQGQAVRRSYATDADGYIYCRTEDLSVSPWAVSYERTTRLEVALATDDDYDVEPWNWHSEPDWIKSSAWEGVQS